MTVAIMAVGVVMLFPSLLTNFDGILGQEGGTNPIVTILQPQGQKPKFVAQEELVQYALREINNDRADFGLPPVELSPNQAAQIHAEDVFKTKQISHWTSSGEKPYMTYTNYGGEGSVNQNVAIAGFGPAQYERCVSLLAICEKIDPLETIEELEYEMVYEDKECCNDGHRKNILDAQHTHVSIGIVYDEYYLAFVQNFENNYGLDVAVNGGQVRISGTLPADTSLDHISIYYDEMPTPDVYEQNKRLGFYAAGKLVASVLEPLPPGYYYQKVPDQTLILANRWVEQDGSIDILFDLAAAVENDGVYTLYAQVENENGEKFQVTSYSIFVES